MHLKVFSGKVWDFPSGDHSYEEIPNAALYDDKNYFSISFTNDDKERERIENFRIGLFQNRKWYLPSEVIYCYKFLNHKGNFPRILEPDESIQLSFPFNLSDWKRNKIDIMVDCEVSGKNKSYIVKLTP